MVFDTSKLPTDVRVALSTTDVSRLCGEGRGHIRCVSLPCEFQSGKAFAKSHIASTHGCMVHPCSHCFCSFDSPPITALLPSPIRLNIPPCRHTEASDPFDPSLEDWSGNKIRVELVGIQVLDAHILLPPPSLRQNTDIPACSQV